MLYEVRGYGKKNNCKIMKKIILLLLTINMHAQFTNVMISNQNTPSEPSIVIDPNNTDIQFAASNINNYYVSTDNGMTWSENTLSSSLGVWGDPSLAIDNSGDFYFFHLSNPTTGGSWIDRIVCQKSTNKGMSWNDGTFFGLNASKAQDKEWVTIDRTNNNIYLLWTEFDSYGSDSASCKTRILFTKSTDGAATWSTPVKVNSVDGDCVDSDLTVEGAVPAIGPSGEIYTAWTGPNGLVFNKSIDQGSTWLDSEISIDTMPGGWDYNIPGIDRCNGLPIIKCDTSGGANHGTIYVNWTDQRNGTNDTDVWLKKSTDGGNTWSDIIRVNDDDIGSQQFLTWMDIDQTTGYIYCVFYDRRHHTDNYTDVYLAQSIDGGQTFKNVKISESAFLPSSSVFFGDYTNISAHNGVIRPIWNRMDAGQKSIWTAMVSETVLLKTEQFNSVFELSQNYPNPAKKETFISFKLKSDKSVSIVIYNVLGEQKAVVFKHKNFAYGKHVIKIPLSKYNLKQGIYYYQLQINDRIISKKMIIE